MFFVFTLVYYLVQAMEEHTDRVLPSFTKLFSNRAEARAYASLIVANKCGFDFAEITELEVFSDPLLGLTSEEYELATTPL